MDSSLEKRLKRHIIGKPHRFLAISPLGFEQTLINELKSSDIAVATTTNDIEPYHILGDGKIEFTAKITEAWKVVAYSRIANRVLIEVASFKAENFRELEKKASEIPWELFLTTNHQPLTTIHVTCKRSRLYHSDAIAERLYKVIKQTNIPQSEASSKGKARPHTPTPQNLYVNFLDDRCTIWLDLAGEELYKRGHERFVNKAPLKETIAAAMIFEAIRMVSFSLTSKGEARPHTPKLDASGDPVPHFLPTTSYSLLDLMSGSGTFSLEAAYITNNLIPGVCRDFALKHQPAFKEATWKFIIRRENGQSPTDERRQPYKASDATNEVGHDRAEWLGLERSERFDKLTDLNENPKTKDDYYLRRESHVTAQAHDNFGSVMPACKQSVATLASHVTAQAHDNFGSVMPACKQSVATLASHVIASTQCEAIHHPIIAKILTSDISERAVSIVKHNIESSPLVNITPAPIVPQLRDFFSYTAKEIADACGDTSPILVLNPPYGKRLDFNAPKLYTKIGRKLTELANGLATFNKRLTIAVLAPKDDTRNGSKYTCTANLLLECSALDPQQNPIAKCIVTSHGGFSLNVFFTTI